MKTLTKNCLVCGKEFTKKVNESVKAWTYRHKYCSTHCNAVAHKFGENTRFKKGQKAINPIKKGQHISPSTEFKKGIVPIYHFPKGNIPWNKGLPTELQPNYRKGKGTTKLGILIRTMNRYKDWRTKVFIRDKHTCQSCGAKRKKGDRVVIQCHHLKPFYQIIDEYKITNAAEASKCSELWDTDNGLTLCVLCHKQTDSYLINQYTK
jgi:hypothetical protein